MAGSHSLGVALALVLALAGTAPAAAGGSCDRARSIFAERDRTGDVAATRPRRDCNEPSNAELLRAETRPAARKPDDIHRTPSLGLFSDPLAYSSGFTGHDPLALSPGTTRRSIRQPPSQ